MDDVKPFVFLAMPRRGRAVSFAASRAFHAWATRGACAVALADAMSTVLDQGFNLCWAGALNARAMGVTHFAMLHDDVAPLEAGWLDVLLRELGDADAVSAVVPIKDRRGLTSTAVETGDVWSPRRLTLREAHALPETFGDAEAGGELLLNTGCWLCRLDRPWADDPPWFQTASRLRRDAEGQYHAEARSEDWEFSRELRRRGAKLLATRAVRLDHVGEDEFGNDAWGDWSTDLAARARAGGS